ncbi:MAG: hypothetical protein Q9187_005680 [Circinaria calcarea]
MAEAEPSYIDYETFLDPNFSPTSFANSLVTTTNDASDTQLDLSTPLSKVLFDVQEIDTHIHTLASKSAIPLLNYTKEQSDASQRIVEEVEAQVASLTDGYRRLEEEVIQRFDAAEEVRIAVERLWHTVKIGRAVGRCLLLGRQLEAQTAEIGLNADTINKQGNHKAMVRASNTILTLRQLLAAAGPGEEGEHLSRIQIVTALQSSLLAPLEQKLRTKAQQIIHEFSMSSLGSPADRSIAPSNLPSAPITYAQSEETKARTTSACLTLYLLSPVSAAKNPPDFQPVLLLAALQSYLQTSLTSSLASTARALGTLPTLHRTLLEVSARCQNIVALETLLESIRPPPHPLLSTTSSPRQVLKSADSQSSQPSSAAPVNLLQSLLLALDTSSLPSFFWRSLASGLSVRVQELLNKGGGSARTLKSQRETVRERIRECVVRGCAGAKVKGEVQGGWEREVGVMVGSVVGVLGR